MVQQAEPFFSSVTTTPVVATTFVSPDPDPEAALADAAGAEAMDLGAADFVGEEAGAADLLAAAALGAGA